MAKRFFVERCDDAGSIVRDGVPVDHTWDVVDRNGRGGEPTAVRNCDTRVQARQACRELNDDAAAERSADATKKLIDDWKAHIISTAQLDARTGGAVSESVITQKDEYGRERAVGGFYTVKLAPDAAGIDAVIAEHKNGD